MSVKVEVEVHPVHHGTFQCIQNLKGVKSLLQFFITLLLSSVALVKGESLRMTLMLDVLICHSNEPGPNLAHYATSSNRGLDLVHAPWALPSINSDLL